MKALHHVLIRTDRSYNNKEKVGNTDFTVNVDIDNVESINRTATVVSAPEGIDLDSGDVVVVHHNIMRENIRIDKKKTKGMYYIADDYYWVPVSEVIMKKSNNTWIPLHNFVFLKPIKQENIQLKYGLTLIPRSRKGMQELRAELAITNKKLEGVEVGDKVYFSRNSEHEFIIEGETLFKCEIEDILGKYE